VSPFDGEETGSVFGTGIEENSMRGRKGGHLLRFEPGYALLHPVWLCWENTSYPNTIGDSDGKINRSGDEGCSLRQWALIDVEFSTYLGYNNFFDIGRPHVTGPTNHYRL
jgi:hypothetical protein